MNRNPWIGLTSYNEDIISNGYMFCGRTAATMELYSLVDNNIFVTMYGKSGIGKSSILQAGLFPKLRANSYLPVYIRLGVEDDSDVSYARNITDALEQELEKRGYESCCTKEPLSHDNEEYLWDYFANREFRDNGGNVVYPVIVLDQFEELFFRSKDKLSLMFRQLYLLLDDSSLSFNRNNGEDITNFRILLSIREDDFFRLEDIVERMRLIEMKYNRYRLTELSYAEAKEVITAPAAGLFMDNDAAVVVERIISIIRGEDGEINSAMLSLLCSRIYEATIGKGDTGIGMESVESFLKASGGNFMESFYTDVIANFKDRKKWEYIEEVLVTDDGRRNSILKSQFERNVPDSQFLFYGKYAMLRYVTYSSAKEPHVEIIHDLLAGHMKNSRNERLLKTEAAKMRRKRRNAAVIVFVLAIAGFFAFQSYMISEKNKEITQKQKNLLINQSKYLVSEAQKEYDKGNITLALRMALYALPECLNNTNRPYVDEAEAMLRLCDTPQKLGAYCRSFLKHGDLVNSAVFSPDGKYVVTASYDHTARICDAQTGKPVTEPMKHRDYVYSAAFSPDGEFVVTASGDHTARIWDARTGKPVTEPMKHENSVNSAVFSPDGKYVVTASYDHTARIWDAQTGKPVTEPMKHEKWVNSAVFSPDGKFVVTASGDHTARIWDSKTGKPMMEQTKQIIALQELIDKYRKDPEHDWSLTEDEKEEYSLE